MGDEHRSTYAEVEEQRPDATAILEQVKAFYRDWDESASAKPGAFYTLKRILSGEQMYPTDKAAPES